MKRVILIVLITLVFIIIETLNWIGFLLDEIFYPKYKYTQIISPIFIVGLPRTATTYLQKILAIDRVTFTTMSLWEILFSPSIIQKRFFLFLGKIDKKFNGHFRNKLAKLDDRLFNVFKDVHPSSLFEPEEDDMILMHIFSGLYMIFLFPKLKRLKNAIRFDESLSNKSQTLIMSYYRKCIQKHLYVFGKDKVYLSKSPNHTPKIKSINKIFPDCRFICTIRNPVKVIPSSLSLFGLYCKRFRTTYTREAMVTLTLELADFWYKHPLKIFSSLPKNKYAIVIYDSFTKQPIDTIVDIYKKFRLTFTESYKESILKSHIHRFKTNHEYSLEQFGLTTERIEILFKTYFIQYKKLYENENKQGRLIPVSMVQN